MMKYVWNSLEMYGMGSEIERYGLDSWKKLDISEKCRKSRKIKVLRMAPPGGQNDRTPCESILALSRGSQLPYTSKEVLTIF